MSDIGKGDWVECIRSDVLGRTAQGRIYVVERIVSRPLFSRCHNDGCRDPFLRMVGVKYSRSDANYGDCVHRFRPLGGHHERTETHSRDRVPA